MDSVEAKTAGTVRMPGISSWQVVVSIITLTTPFLEDGTLVNDAPGHGSASLRQQLAFLKSFMEGFDFIRLKPSRHLVKLAPGTVPQVLADEGKEYAVYLNGGSQCDLQLYLPPGKYQATWLNTVSFDIEKSDEFDHKGGVKKIISPQYDRDIALKIIMTDGK